MPVGVTIKVNGSDNSLVHKGSNHIAKNTPPDVCKTPSPGGPVPIPYPVIVSMSSDLAKGTTTVKADGGNMAAIKGSEFSRCSGDEAGTAGGVVSSTNMKEATWILYSFDVKMDGKNACRLTDSMKMNHGNTVCMRGVGGTPVAVTPKDMLECGEVGTYSELQKKAAAPKFERDHIPSKASLLKRAKKLKNDMSTAEIACVKAKVTARGMAVAIPTSAHRGFSPTCGSRNTPEQISSDASSKNKMNDAVNRDTKEMQKHLDEKHKKCAEAYKEATKKIKEHDNDKMIKQAIKECTS
jgi:hypothetical protein